MKLPPGATGFDAAPDTGTDLSAFTAICHHAARAVGGTVSQIVPANVTPNFHTAEIARRGLRTRVLGHTTIAAVAFAEPWPAADLRVTFTDRPDLAAALQEVSDLRILTKQQLDSPIATADLTALTAGEHEQITYWQPHTIGELLFNYWD
ncbi:hypothetical protein Adi01nite_68170 [Amorphoplanes digitatis]|uniref:Uncharacterized protein n=1 Tax=Actinoplanes digitatis TaxID=1868 RepID=A0A7W7I734_9ACTN|nr:hypothetical protein [Actinoplanes digitatis]MBB4767521.1 hypothetical protein [Actinoplanes digitatis]GID97405.1 hypothetical protein Adi01nite_68170 [Actinoplanes digitatis]